MASEELYKKLSYTRAYRKTRLDVAQWVMDHPETFPELLEFCFQKDEEISYRATWILECICLADFKLLLPHLDIFFNTIPNIYKNQAVRPLAKICEKLMIATYKTKNEAIIKSITEAHKSIIIECCFDWLITQQKVACQVYSMLALYFLGTQYDWIHPELKTIINKNIHQGSAAYKARGKYVLQQIEKFKAK
ncbi:MAG: hypothetical protein ACI9D4_000766 [Polaribacter sp.]|jgi:hypothetical protein